MRFLALLLVLAVAVLGTVLLAALPLGGQARDSQSQAADSPSLPNERDVAAMKKALENDSTDLEEMAKSLGGVEFDAALSIDQKRGKALWRWMLRFGSSAYTTTCSAMQTAK